MLLVRLHDYQTPDAKGMPTFQFYWSPLEIHAHGAAVVVELWDMGQNLRIHLRTDVFGKVLGELRIRDGRGDRGLDSKGSAFVKFYRPSQVSGSQPWRGGV